MKKGLVVNLMMVFLVAGLLLTVSCAKKTVVADATKVEDQTAAPATVQDQTADEAARKAKLEEEQRIAEENLRAAKAAAEKRRFSEQDIHFAYDSSELTPMATTLLREKAEFLKAYPQISVTIEGHCDERGTTEYNLALGERRAKSAQNYLINLGIPASRMTTISYGKERPLDPGQNEAAWQKNRRAHFVVK